MCKPRPALPLPADRAGAIRRRDRRAPGVPARGRAGSRRVGDRGVAWLAVAALAVGLTGCGVPARPAADDAGAGGLRIVAAENFWGDITGQLAGPYAAVTSLIDRPTADPHLFESNIRAARAVDRADLVVANGLGYDDFVDRLVRASSGRHPAVLTVAHVLGARTGDNPHLWYDTARLPAVAAAITRRLEQLDPAHAGLFRAKLAGFTQSLAPLSAAIGGIRTRWAGVGVAQTERVGGYLLAAAGLRVRSPAAYTASIENGSDPGPRVVAQMNAVLRSHRVRLLVYNVQATSPVTQRLADLARHSGVAVVPVSETMPSGAHDFQAWQLGQVRALAAALSG